ncbi:MAG: DUF3710 domain-containing protein [Actinomycetota bacterium]
MIDYGRSKSAPVDRSTAGPFDVSEIIQIRPLIDFGSVQLPAREDIVLKLEVEEASSRIVALTVELNGSQLQVQAFSAPASEGIWHEIRDALASSITEQGGEVETVIGPLGPELNAQIPGPYGVKRLAKFIGVDGPKWFLRGVISGTALSDPLEMSNIIDIFRSIVIDRGFSPLPPKDLLPLSAPAGAKKLAN